MVEHERWKIFCHHLGMPQFFCKEAFHSEEFVSYITLSERIRRKA